MDDILDTRHRLQRIEGTDLHLQRPAETQRTRFHRHPSRNERDGDLGDSRRNLAVFQHFLSQDVQEQLQRCRVRHRGQRIRQGFAEPGANLRVRAELGRNSGAITTIVVVVVNICIIVVVVIVVVVDVTGTIPLWWQW